MNRGVPLHDLCCPSCGSDFFSPGSGGVTMRQDLDEYDLVTGTLRPVEIKRPPDLYLQCRKNGHKWSVKTIWRCENGPDEVLLDRLIGQE